MYNYRIVLGSVEAYDHIADTWPNMIDHRSNHNLVAMGDKLFVINHTCEVYDGSADKFVSIKKTEMIGFLSEVSRDLVAVPMASKILVFRKNKSEVISYDVDKEEWCKEKFEIEKYKLTGSCVKIPYLK